MDCSEEYTQEIEYEEQIDDSDADPTYQPPDQATEPSSPPLSGGCSALYRKRQREKSTKGKDANFEQAMEKLNAARDRITCPTVSDDDDEINRSQTSKKHKEYNRFSPSVIWHHVKKISKDGVKCNHCPKIWHNLGGSTSTPLKHLR